MTDLVFVDTNVLIYARDDRGGPKRDQARTWLSMLAGLGTMRLNMQVLNELRRWVLANERSRPLDTIREEIELLEFWGDQAVTSDDVAAAWDLRARHGFQWFDCLLVAAAGRLGCRYFLTEDMVDRTSFGELVLVNPFRISPSDLLQQH